LRIIHVNGEKGFSGGEDQTFHLMEYLREVGDTNILVGRRGGAAAAEARRRGFETHELAMRNSLDVAAIFALRRLFRRLRPQVIHMHTSRAHVLGAWAARGLGCPARVATRRMDYPLRRNPFTRFLYGSGVDRVVAISRAVREEVLKLGLSREKVALVPDGVEVERFRGISEQGEEEKEAARELWGLAAGSPAVGSIGSLHRRKGQDLLVEAVALLSGRGVECSLLVAGAGPREEELRHLVAARGVEERVSFLGHVTPPERLYRALDIFCMPSRKEGLGVAALEAMAAGLPVVAAAVGGLAESVEEGRTGLLVPPDDPARLAAALERLLADGELRRELGARGVRRVGERYSSRAMGGGNRSIYQELLGSP